MRFRCNSPRTYIGLLALMAASCAALLPHPERPEVSIAGIKLIEAGLLEQRYQVKLRLQNPNDFDLPIDGAHFQLKLNDKPFVSGVSGAPVTVPRYGSALLDIEATTTLAGLTKQLKNIASGQTVHYKLTGKVHLTRPMLELPLTAEGEMSLPWLEQKPSN